MHINIHLEFYYLLKLTTRTVDFICNPFKNVSLYRDVSLRIQPPTLSESDSDLLLSHVSDNPIIKAFTLSVCKSYSNETGNNGIVVFTILAVASGSLRL